MAILVDHVKIRKDGTYYIARCIDDCKGEVDRQVFEECRTTLRLVERDNVTGEPFFANLDIDGMDKDQYLLFRVDD